MTVVAYLLRILAGFVMVVAVLVACLGLANRGPSLWIFGGAVAALVFGGILWMLTVIHEELGRLDESLCSESNTSSKVARFQPTEPHTCIGPQAVSK
jgi:hypothetical protein